MSWSGRVSIADDQKMDTWASLVCLKVFLAVRWKIMHRGCILARV